MKKKTKVAVTAPVADAVSSVVNTVKEHAPETPLKRKKRRIKRKLVLIFSLIGLGAFAASKSPCLKSCSCAGKDCCSKGKVNQEFVKAKVSEVKTIVTEKSPEVIEKAKGKTVEAKETVKAKIVDSKDEASEKMIEVKETADEKVKSFTDEDASSSEVPTPKDIVTAKETMSDL